LRLLGKIASAVLVGIILLLVIDGYLSVRREIALFDSDMARDGILLGQTLRPLVASAWNEGGDTAATRVIEEADSQNGNIDIRWVRLDDASSNELAPRADKSSLGSFVDGDELSIKFSHYRYTYVGVPIDGGRAAIELSESTPADCRPPIWVTPTMLRWGNG